MAHFSFTAKKIDKIVITEGILMVPDVPLAHQIEDMAIGSNVQNVGVSFDFGTPVSYEANPGERFDALSFRFSSDFVGRLMKAKTIVVYVSFPKVGRTGLMFNVGGFHWPDKVKMKAKVLWGY